MFIGLQNIPILILKLTFDSFFLFRFNARVSLLVYEKNGGNFRACHAWTSCSCSTAPGKGIALSLEQPIRLEANMKKNAGKTNLRSKNRFKKVVSILC